MSSAEPIGKGASPLAGEEMSSAEPPGNGGNSARNRHFCLRCSNIILVVSSAGSAPLCPICQAEFTEESDRSSSSSANISRPLNPEAAPSVLVPPSTSATISRTATFEHRNPSDNFVRLVSESGFFSSSYPNSEAIVIPMLRTGTVLSFRLLRRYLDDCVNEGANINSNLRQHQILQLFENFDNLNHLEYAPQFAIASLPEVKITEDRTASSEGKCPICTEDFKIGEEAKQLPCKHLYHKDCIVPWLRQRKSCPFCRFELKISDPSYDRLRAAWIPQPLAFSSTGEDTAGSGEQNAMQPSSDSMATRFQIELLWPVETTSSRFEIRSSIDGQGSGGSGERSSEGSSDNDA